MSRSVLTLPALAVGASAMLAQQPAATSPITALLTTPATAVVERTNSPTVVVGPKIQFATPVYDFGRAVAGEAVKHTYVFTNRGDRLLEIRGVHTSCGCTTAADWSKQVAPGQTGSIPIEFTTANFNGAVSKTITVVCSDPTTPTVALTMKGTIWRPVEVSPQFAVLNVTPDSPGASAVVKIVNNMNEPLRLFDPQSGNRAFAVEIRTNQPGKEFQLVISTVTPLSSGTVQGPVTVKSSSTNAPVISVSALAIVQPALLVTPSVIVLPPTLASNRIPSAVHIRINTTNLVTLSEPSINAAGIDVQIREVVPGRQFTVTTMFPAGFEMAPGQNVELSVKTSHPGYPSVKVPVRQLAARPVPAAPMPGPPPPGASAIPASPPPAEK